MYAYVAMYVCMYAYVAMYVCMYVGISRYVSMSIKAILLCSYIIFGKVYMYIHRVIERGKGYPPVTLTVKYTANHQARFDHTYKYVGATAGCGDVWRG